MKSKSRLLFEGGSLSFNRLGYGEADGDGEISFKDGDLEYAGHEAEYRALKIPRSELIAIRDFLIKELAEGGAND